MNQLLASPKPQKCVPHITGLSSPDEPGLCDPLVPVRRPLSLAWVSDEAIVETQRLWSARYGREVSEDEAIEILRNVKRFAEMLLEGNVE